MTHNNQFNNTPKKYQDRFGNNLNVNDIIDYADPDTQSIKSYLVQRIDKLTITLVRKGEKKILKDIDTDLYHKEGTAIQDPDLLKDLFDIKVNDTSNMTNVPNKLGNYNVKITLRSGKEIYEDVIATSEDEALDNAMPLLFEINDSNK